MSLLRSIYPCTPALFRLGRRTIRFFTIGMAHWLVVPDLCRALQFNVEREAQRLNEPTRTWSLRYAAVGSLASCELVPVIEVWSVPQWLAVAERTVTTVERHPDDPELRLDAVVMPHLLYGIHRGQVPPLPPLHLSRSRFGHLVSRKRRHRRGEPVH